MKIRTRRFAAACTLAAAMLSGNVRAWDPAGHMLVGQIAWEQTRPEARERVEELVRTLEATYNAEQPYNFITAGCWMDDMRSKQGYAWSKWHYVTIPWTPDGSAFALPPAPHVVWAIEESLKTLKASSSLSSAGAVAPQPPMEKRAEALAMLMHFVGDVHQPLHATDRNDRGGNGTLITGVPFTDLWAGTVANLHAFWDKAFRFQGADAKVIELWQCPPTPERPNASTEGAIKSAAARIMAEFPRAGFEALVSERNPGEWARESHLLGCKLAYPAGAEPRDDQVFTLTPEFASAARQAAARQVALAGYRLAVLLNELFGDR